MFNIIKKKIPFGESSIYLETGKVARQADSSVIARMGNTMVLCTVTKSKNPLEGVDFVPLSTHYLEKFYAAGKFPGGFIKRETKPSEREVLISRLIDRPIRPLIPSDYRNEVQVICTVLSYDKENESDIVATIAASAALTISGVPFMEPIASARVGYRDDKFILNPTLPDIYDSKSDMLDLVVSGTHSSVLMVESEIKNLSEDKILDAIEYAHNSFRPVIDDIREFANEVGEKEKNYEKKDLSDLHKTISEKYGDRTSKAYAIIDKKERSSEIDMIYQDILNELSIKDSAREGLFEENDLQYSFKELRKEIVRNYILDKSLRIDSRKTDEIRPISCELDILPNAHGSSLFTRGETQALGVVTLGSNQDRQTIDSVTENRQERFLLHYNFPQYSVGECGRIGPPGRREIGHGKLAYRALRYVIPEEEKFPYTIRVVSEIMESNGSSSMATVCASSLAMMAAGVKADHSVAGIAMGLIKKGDRYSVLSDIMADEDHLGDMDFKVAGTSSGITSLQMDIKINGIDITIMKDALRQARRGIDHILGIMDNAISNPQDVASHAPRVEKIKINTDKIKNVIGSGGKNIKEICELCEAKIDISDDGDVSIFCTSQDSMDRAKEMISNLTTDPKVGELYKAKVIKLMDFGLIISILGGAVEGLVHFSETPVKKDDLASKYNIGDEIDVVVKFVERGRYNFSMKLDSVNSNDKPRKNNRHNSNKNEKREGSEKRGGSENKREKSGNDVAKKEKPTESKKKKFRLF